MTSEKDKEIREVMKQETGRGKKSRIKNTLKEREETLAFVLDYGTEDDYLDLLKNWKVPITQDLIDEFRKRRREKRGLL